MRRCINSITTDPLPLLVLAVSWTLNGFGLGLDALVVFVRGESKYLHKTPLASREERFHGVDKWSRSGGRSRGGGHLLSWHIAFWVSLYSRTSTNKNIAHDVGSRRTGVG